MAALDRKRPFGSVSNDSEGRAYEQDGTFYRADGSAWAPNEPEGDPPSPAKPAAKKKAAATDSAPLDDQLNAQMGNA